MVKGFWQTFAVVSPWGSLPLRVALHGSPRLSPALLGSPLLSTALLGSPQLSPALHGSPRLSTVLHSSPSSLVTRGHCPCKLLCHGPGLCACVPTCTHSGMWGIQGPGSVRVSRSQFDSQAALGPWVLLPLVVVREEPSPAAFLAATAGPSMGGGGTPSFCNLPTSSSRSMWCGFQESAAGWIDVGRDRDAGVVFGLVRDQQAPQRVLGALTPGDRTEGRKSIRRCT